MNKSCIIIIFFILVLFQVNLSLADNLLKIYNQQHRIVGYVVTDDDGNKTFYDSSWSRTGHSVYENNRTVIYNKDQNRVGLIKWDGNTGTEFDGAGNRIGHLRKEGSRIILFDKRWNRQGYKE